MGSCIYDNFWKIKDLLLKKFKTWTSYGKIAIIPLRSGSKRLQKKIINYLIWTLAEIARDKCFASDIFDKIVISRNYPYFKKLTNCNKVDFLQRKSYLTDNNTTTDVVVDFFIWKFHFLWTNTLGK